jgi:hypothetical protein
MSSTHFVRPATPRALASPSRNNSETRRLDPSIPSARIALVACQIAPRDPEGQGGALDDRRARDRVEASEW